MTRRYVTGRRGRRNRVDDDGDEDAAGPSIQQLFLFFLTVVSTMGLMMSGRNVHTMDNMPDPHADNKSPLASVLASVKGQTEAPFAQSEFKYGVEVTPSSEYTLPPPKRTNETTVVIVLTTRHHFDRRAAIRETWAADNDNVYFVIGGPQPDDKEDKDLSNPLSVSSLLAREQELYADIIDSIHPDSYKSLPFKLHFGMRWVWQNIPHVNWVVKADDDQLVRVKLLQFYVLRKLNPRHTSVVGQIVVNAPPHRTGRWAEDPKFTAETYPPWAFGSAGYVVSRPVLEYVANQPDLYYYQGEDASLGIWLSESPLQITWIDTPEVVKDKSCDQKHYIIGHELSVEELKACWNVLLDEVPDRKSVIAFDAGRKDQHPNKISQW